MFIPIRIENGKIINDGEIETYTFKDLNLKEDDIEEFIRKNISTLMEDEENLLIIGQQVKNKEKGRSDLVAIDESGNLVLIEIKRDVEDIINRKEPFEFQAIRYAANYATIQDENQLVNDLFAPYIEKHREEFEEKSLTSIELANRILNSFLNDNNLNGNFNKKQRIVLVASQFDPQTLSACAWLIDNGVDIKCFTIEPVKINSQLGLELKLELPQKSNEDFFVEIKSPNIKRNNGNKENTTERKQLPKMDKLFEWEIVKNGDILKIKNREDSEAKVINEKEVEFKGEKMSFSNWGKKVTSWNEVNIYENSYSTRLDDTLHNLRLQKMSELKKDE